MKWQFRFVPGHRRSFQSLLFVELQAPRHLSEWKEKEDVPLIQPKSELLLLLRYMESPEFPCHIPGILTVNMKTTI